MKKLIILLATCLIPFLHGAAGGGQTQQDRIRYIPSLRELALKESGQELTHALQPSLIPQDASSSSALPESTTLPFDIRSTASSSSRPLSFIPQSSFQESLERKLGGSESAQHFFAGIQQAINRITAARVTREAIAAYINSLKIGDTPIANTTLAHELINATASAIAHDEYLRLRSQDRLSAQNAYNKLSPFLQEHFAGVSIQDLITNNLLLNQSYGNNLDIFDLHISSLKGLESVPNINNIKVLNLSGNLLTALEPGVFTELSNLEWLLLENNQLTDLEPGTFAGLTKLKRLSLSNNQLTALERGTFAGLTKLEALFLNSNQLTDLEQGTFAKLSNLEVLALNSNQLTTLEIDVFAGLTNLQMLRLESNQLNALKSGVFTELSNLKYLYLNNNQLTAVEPGVFAGLTNLELLYLGNNQLTEEEQVRIRTELQTVAPNAEIEF